MVGVSFLAAAQGGFALMGDVEIAVMRSALTLLKAYVIGSAVLLGLVTLYEWLKNGRR